MITKEQFSPEQTQAYEHCIGFVHDPNRNVTVVRGYAGTGKTAMMRVLVEELENQRKKVVCTAPTNEAVRVIAKLTGKKYNKTIYSLLGLQLIEEDDTDAKLRREGKSTVEKYDVIIVDEASMINSDLYNAIIDEISMFSRCNVIFVGDPAQLPPVKDPLGESLVFSVKDFVQLVTIQRTTIGNPIIESATAIRNNLTSKVDLYDRVTRLNESGDTGIEFVSNPNDFLDMMLEDFESDEFKNDANYVRLLAYTNRTVDGFNDLIRQKIWHTKTPDEYIVGERLLVDSPIVRFEAGVREVVYNVGERLEVLKAFRYSHEKGFCYWELDVINYEAEKDDQYPYTINVICKSDMSVYRKEISKLATECKKRVNETVDRRGVMVKKFDKATAWKPYFDFKNEFHFVRYNYALTVHKSQGSTFKRVYVVEMDLNKLTWNDVERNKLKYVAFTRASHLLRLL